MRWIAPTTCVEASMSSALNRVCFVLICADTTKMQQPMLPAIAAGEQVMSSRSRCMATRPASTVGGEEFQSISYTTLDAWAQEPSSGPRELSRSSTHRVALWEGMQRGSGADTVMSAHAAHANASIAHFADAMSVAVVAHPTKQPCTEASCTCRRLYFARTTQ